MGTANLVLERDARGVVTLRLNRPQRRNALDAALIGALGDALRRLAEATDVRILVLRGAGATFCAGADLAWMRAAAHHPGDRNEADARALADMLHRLNTLPMPTVAVVHGGAFGGGVGLAACCDIVIAAQQAQFGLSEVRLGLIPATIAPYVIAAIGAAQARRYVLTGERFDAPTAQRLGLVHALASDTQLADTLERFITELLHGGPQAQAAAKRLIADVATHPVDASLRADTARRMADCRVSAEAQAGLAAFFNRVPAPWQS